MEETLRYLLETFGYLAIVVVTFLEGETIVILAGIAAAHGYMNPPWVAVAALAGGFAGDQLWYAIGRKYGPRVLARWPNLQPKADYALTLLHKYDLLFIFSFRFVYGVRNVTPFVIGGSGYPRIRFTVINFLAAVLWAVSFTAIGWGVGQAATELSGGKSVAGGLAAIVFVVLLAVLVPQFVKARRRAKERAAQTPAALPAAAPGDGPTGP